MKTFLPKPDQIERRWLIVDATDQSLGRLASKIALLLQGKRKSIYTPHIDTGDFVIVINADKVKLTGKKWDQKVYYRHSFYPGGLKARTAREIFQKNPAALVRLTVRRMLPKNRLGRKMLKRLKVYTGPEHPHQAQKPEVFDINSFN